MAGYKGYSMSNNAVAAYNQGEKPKSKWTKEDLINGILNYNNELTREQLGKYLKNTLEMVLSQSSWHHTSKYYNCTDFYSIDEFIAENLTLEKLNNRNEAIRKNKKRKKEKEENQKDKKCFVQYVNYEGTRNYPKKIYIETYAVIRGKTAYCDNNGIEKKRITGKNFRIIKVYNRAPRGKAKIFNNILVEIEKNK